MAPIGQRLSSLAATAAAWPTVTFEQRGSSSVAAAGNCAIGVRSALCWSQGVIPCAIFQSHPLVGVSLSLGRVSGASKCGGTTAPLHSLLCQYSHVRNAGTSALCILCYPSLCPFFVTFAFRSVLLPFHQLVSCACHCALSTLPPSCNTKGPFFNSLEASRQPHLR